MLDIGHSEHNAGGADLIGGGGTDATSAPDDARREAAIAVERELSVLFSRARSLSLSMAAKVHPELDSASYTLLMQLARFGPVRAADVADTSGHDKSTVSRQLGKLRQLGLIEKVADPSDGRARLVQLTEAGRTRLDAVREMRRSQLRSRFASWTTGDLAAFSRLLAQLNETL